jgi:uncharacterized membrane protein YidH (DUF202 family)
VDTEQMDVGTQAERTALAWQRTGIGAMAVGALLMHGHVHQNLLSPWPGLVLAVVGGAAILVLVPHRYRRVARAIQAGCTPLSRAMVPGATLVLVLVTVGIGVELLCA